MAGCGEDKISIRKGFLALLGWIDPLFFFGWMDETVMLKFKILILFFLLFFTFLKMVLSSVFNFISDFCMYKSFSLLQFRGILRSLKSASHSSHPVCVFVLCFLAANRAHNASKELKEAHCAAVLSTKTSKRKPEGRTSLCIVNNSTVPKLSPYSKLIAYISHISVNPTVLVHGQSG